MAISETTRAERNQAWLALPRAGANTLFESFGQVGAQRGEGGRETAKSAGCHGNNEREDSDTSRRSRWSRCAALTPAEGARRCGSRMAAKTSPSTPPAQAEQQSFEYRFANNRTGARAQSQSNRIFAPPANCPHQQQTGNVDASNQQDHGDG